jgi:hypothetical protein
MYLEMRYLLYLQSTYFFSGMGAGAVPGDEVPGPLSLVPHV